MIVYKSTHPRNRLHFLKQFIIILLMFWVPVTLSYFFPSYFTFNKTTYSLICAALFIGSCIRNGTVSHIAEISFNEQQREIVLVRDRLFSRQQRKIISLQDLELKTQFFSEEDKPLKKGASLSFERSGKELETLSREKDGFLVETLSGILATARQLGIPVSPDRT